MESLEHGLSLLASFLKVILEAISLLCVLIGLLRSLQEIFMLRWRSRRDLRSNSQKNLSSTIFTDFRLNFGIWLLLALEFQLAADIVNTIVAPSFESLGKLGVIAIIRTFLNYFLNQELVETINIQQEQLKLTSDHSDRGTMNE